MEPMTDPRALKKWLILLAVLYLVFPRDLIPDFFGRGLGLIDDLSLAVLLTYLYRRNLRTVAAGAGEAGDARDREPQPERPAAAAPHGPSDPYRVLGIPASASADAIRAAYRARMSEYHPDKVAHLGEDLQKLAHRKAQEIEEAYRQLRL